MDSDKMIEQIKGWHYKAGDNDYFSKYVFEYLAFIGYIQKYRYKEEYDRKAVQSLKQCDETKSKYLGIVNNNENIQHSWNEIITELNCFPLGKLGGDENKWRNCSHSDGNQKTDEEKHKQTGVIHSLEDWENMVEFWYTIRNTLFHGGKDVNDRRDELLVEHGYKTLRPLVEIFISLSD